ncbi:hypothetical protein ASC94_00235 [Massilia sp. Root418]|uniref:DUF2306 domain-containing protein n=1 Tax=Massilia sp. Root418 TaxID=1736532 RepID=UPI0006FD90BD|nr:DUF2306 domain-containing protein [Massilia sp. Root418]KQX01122.1 hypothetical protein ASC94_00235 [Massilia sp. Root418]
MTTIQSHPAAGHAPAPHAAGNRGNPGNPGNRGLGGAKAAGAVLNAAATLWFTVAVIGQLLFAYYVAALYGGAVVRGDPARWHAVAPHAHVPGDTAGNAAFGLHMLLAVVITVGGALQLVPQVRSRAPAFHRWNGRVYVLLAAVASLTGLYMVWARGTVGDLSQHIGVSLNGVLILLCAALAVRHARARDFARHRAWALRLFLAVSGVWFFRVGLMGWIVANQGPAGFDPKTFTGPFLTFLSFAQFLLPLAVLQLYLLARDGGGAVARYAVAAGLAVLTAAMGLGIVAAAAIMWLPRL